MKNILTYLWVFLALLGSGAYGLLGTETGNGVLSPILGSYLSQQSHNNIEVSTLQLKDYPQLYTVLRINDDADLELNGTLSSEMIDMVYHLKGERFRFDDYHLTDRVDLMGHLQGPLQTLAVDGNGQVLGGKSDYRGIVHANQVYKAVQLHAKGIAIEQLLTLLKQEPKLQGSMDINASFSHLSKEHQEGNVWARIPQAQLIEPPMAFSMDAFHATIKDGHYRFDARLRSDVGRVVLREGEFDATKTELRLRYDLDIPHLEALEPFVHHRYKGRLLTQGRARYNDQGWRVEGSTRSFGGKIGYLYRRDHLKVNLNGVSLVKLLAQYDLPPLVRASLYGTVNDDLNKSVIRINTTMKNTRFQRTKLTDMLHQTTGINLLKHRYDKSHFVGEYQQGELLASLTIDDGNEHLYLKEIKMNTKTNRINAKFEIKMQGQELFGTLYGTIDNPKVSVDMKKLLRYQMEHQLEGILGNPKNEKIQKDLDQVKNILKEVDVDEVTDQAKRLFESFF